MKGVCNKLGDVRAKIMLVRIPRNTERSNRVEQPKKAYRRWLCEGFSVDLQRIKFPLDAQDKHSCDGRPTTVANNINTCIATRKILLQGVEVLVDPLLSAGTRETADDLTNRSTPTADSINIFALPLVEDSKTMNVGVFSEVSFLIWRSRVIPGSVESIQRHDVSPD